MTNFIKYKNKTIEQGIVLGTMDGVVNVLGVMAGLALSGTGTNTIALGILSAGLANAIANSSGFYVSEETISHDQPTIIKATLSSFATSFLSAIILVLPVLLLSPVAGFITSAAIGFAFLFTLGTIFSTSKNKYSLGLKYALIGIIAVIAGYIIGEIIK